MTTAVLIGLGLAAGWPLAVLGVAAGVAMAPVPTFVGVLGVGAVAAVRRRRDRPGPDAEAAFLRGVAAELAGGASLRAALAGAPSGGLETGPAVRAAAAGVSADRVARLLADALPVNGRVVAATWVLAAESGGPAAALFQSLARRATDEGDLIRERRSLTAQARASAWVVAGLPVVLLAGSLASGRLDPGDPVVAVVLAVGGALQVAGIAVVVAMVRGSAR